MPITVGKTHFAYSLLLSKAAIDFVTEYRLMPGAVYERHGPIGGPSSWTVASTATITQLFSDIVNDDSLADEVREVALQLLGSVPDSGADGKPINDPVKT